MLQKSYKEFTMMLPRSHKDVTSCKEIAMMLQTRHMKHRVKMVFFQIFRSLKFQRYTFKFTICYEKFNSNHKIWYFTHNSSSVKLCFQLDNKKVQSPLWTLEKNQIYGISAATLLSIFCYLPSAEILKAITHNMFYPLKEHYSSPWLSQRYRYVIEQYTALS